MLGYTWQKLCKNVNFQNDYITRPIFTDKKEEWISQRINYVVASS